jgi:hypothetical protein
VNDGVFDAAVTGLDECIPALPATAMTFPVRSSVKPGSMKPQSGNVAQLTADTIVFRLEGRKGERVAFSFESPAR